MATDLETHESEADSEVKEDGAIEAGNGTDGVPMASICDFARGMRHAGISRSVLSSTASTAPSPRDDGSADDTPTEPTASGGAGEGPAHGARQFRAAQWLSKEEEQRVFEAAQRAYDAVFASHTPPAGDVRPRERPAGAMIPRIVHHIWLGSPLPRRFARLRRTWEAAHAAWRHALWTDADVAALPLRNREAYDAAANYGEKSDILRYELLWMFGGVYVDVDMQCLAPLDDIHERVDFYVGFSNTGTLELNNAIIGCARAHPLMRRLADRVRQKEPPSPMLAMAMQLGVLPDGVKPESDAMSTIRRTGPGFVSQQLLPLLVGREVDAPAGGDDPEVAAARWAALREARASFPELTAEADASDAVVAASPMAAGAPPFVAFPCCAFYPLPNTARGGEPPPLAVDDEALAAWSARVEAALSSGGGDSAAELAAAARDAVGSTVATHLRECSLAVHYWAASWQR